MDRLFQVIYILPVGRRVDEALGIGDEGDLVDVVIDLLKIAEHRDEVHRRHLFYDAVLDQRAEILLPGPAGPRHVPAQPLHFLLIEPQVDFDVSSGHVASFRLAIRVWGYPNKPMCRQSTMLAKKMPQAFSTRHPCLSAPDFSLGYTARL